MARKVISALSRIRDVGAMLKISHTVFALPFALASMLLAAGGLPSWRLILLIVLAMFLARNAGMSFNRYLDADSDAKNPRTASRHIPRGLLSRRFVLLFSLVNAALFAAVSWKINRLCFLLSPVALALLFSYSFMKRVTDFSHLVLGLVLGSSPIAAWAAVRGELSWEPFLLGLGVLFWVAGFDMIYATQDYDFDRRAALRSLAVRLGVGGALRWARVFHAAGIALLLAFGGVLHLGWIYHLSVLIIALLLAYEHSLVSEKDLSRVNAAFFNVNGFISLLFLAGVVFAFWGFWDGEL
jgi:4-hydroxybenzoate polyprenyltransferase